MIGCEEETPNEPPPQDYPDYYPGSIGSTFKYSVTEKDSAGNLVQSGTRNILYSGTYLYNGIDYTTQDDSLDFGSQSSVDNISLSEKLKRLFSMLLIQVKFLN